MKTFDEAPTLWRSVEEARRGDSAAAPSPELPMPGPDIVAMGSLNRRKFLGLAGLAAAMAGAGVGCIRKPEENIVPYSKRPEDLIPGRPRTYATCARIGGTVLGLLVESQDGRPTKIEGNPKHPMSLGSASAWAQAEVLNLYDPDRSRTPMRQRVATSWEAARAALEQQVDAVRASRGKGLALLVEDLPSPTGRRLLRELQDQLPEAAVYAHDGARTTHSEAGLAMLGVPRARISHDIERAEVILALDSDFLGTEGDAVRNARAFARGRQANRPSDSMNRLYAVEAFFTVTGAAADHRLRLRSAELAQYLGTLLAELTRLGMDTTASDALLSRLKAYPADRYGSWISAVAKDLWAHRGRCLILVGSRQPAEVHALATLVNHALGAVGGPLAILQDPGAPQLGTLVDLSVAIQAGQVQTLVMLGGNPAYDAPGDLDLPALLAKVPVSFHLSSHLDETSALSTWHLPRSHFLEAWGDLQASDGTVGIQQPLIAPLFDTISEIELLAAVLRSPSPRGYDLVRATWREDSAGFERSWRTWLNDGVVGKQVTAIAPALSSDRVAQAWPSTLASVPTPASLDLEFRLDPSVLDGRYANNGWMQEVPDPVSKLTWDNAAYLSPRTAESLGVTTGDVVRIQREGRSCRIAVFVMPGTADDIVVLPIGYGRREGGKLAVGTGFDVNPLRRASSPWSCQGAQLAKTGEKYSFATTQEHGSMEGRPIVMEASLQHFREHPRFAREAIDSPGSTLLFTPSNAQGGQQWGMSIDLGACIGCNACTVACQAENNIPVVGKQRVLERREMHWIRIDRYYTGSVEDPRMVHQPMACQHCETAPCETVCPVGATTHSPEGLNDQAYQRCIGTRYCSNNCPYKVRRFNFFQYNKGLDPLVQMQKNPDVTLRFRGVMEKCTYCVQRINQAKIAAKRDGNGTVPDGAIVTACQQTCPTQAISFGDVSDPKSAVAQRKGSPRDYGVLADLNTRPRTTYLARLRNPNTEMEPS